MKKINFRSRTTVITLVTLGVLLIGGGLVWAQPWNNDDTKKPVVNGPDRPQPISGEANLDPPTEQEKQEAEAHKDELVQQQNEANQTPSNQKKQVTVTITNATKSMTNVYVSGVVEDGGECSAVYKKGFTTVTATSAGFSNATTTNCEPLTPNLPSDGDWSVTVSYNSARASGSSAAVTFKTP